MIIRNYLLTLLFAAFHSELGYADNYLQTCDQQYACVTWTLSEWMPVKYCSASNCEFKLCLTADFTKAGCNLTVSDSIDNACGETGNACAVPQTSVGWNKPFANGNTICQYGAGGRDLLFVMQDSKMCNFPNTYYPFDDKTLRATCTAEGAQGVCRNQNGECVWRVTLPSCPRASPSGSPSGSVSATPSRSPSMSRKPSRSPRATPSQSPSRSPSPSPGRGGGGYVQPRPSASGSRSPASPRRSISPQRSAWASRSPSPRRSPSPFASPSASPSPRWCIDLEGWVDSNGDDCDTYVEKEWCNKTRGYGRGWTGGSFQARANEDGIDATQACCGCGRNECVSDVVLVVDRSGSIGDNWPLVMQYLRDRVSGTKFNGDMGNRMAIILFSTESQLQCNMTYDQQGLLKCIDSIQYTGGFTFMADAINLAGQHLAERSSPERTRAIEVITDGESTNPKQDTQDAARNQKQNGVIMIAIGVGTEPNEEELKGIASVPKIDHYAYLGTWQALGYLAKIMNAQCIPSCPDCGKKDWIASPSPEASNSPTPSPFPSRSPSRSTSVSASPSGSPSPYVSDSPSDSSSESPSPLPSGSDSPAPSPSESSSSSPSESPSESPSPFPSESSSPIPSEYPSGSPSPFPSESSSPIPSEYPSGSPSPFPSESTSSSPSPIPLTSPEASLSPGMVPSPSPGTCSEHSKTPPGYHTYRTGSLYACGFEQIIGILPDYCAPSSTECGVITCDGDLPPEAWEVLKNCE